MKKAILIGICVFMLAIPSVGLVLADPDATKIDINVKPRFQSLFNNNYFFEIYNGNNEPIEAEVVVTTSTGTITQYPTGFLIGSHNVWHPAVGAQGIFSPYELKARAGNLSTGAPFSQVKTADIKGFMFMGFYFVK